MEQTKIKQPLTEDQKGRMIILMATLCFASTVFSVAAITMLMQVDTSIAVAIAGTSGGLSGLIGFLLAGGTLTILNKNWTKYQQA